MVSTGRNRWNRKEFELKYLFYLIGICFFEFDTFHKGWQHVFKCILEIDVLQENVKFIYTVDLYWGIELTNNHGNKFCPYTEF